jgi:glycine cleavage system H protein
MSSGSYPDELLYHPEHAWARIEDGEAVFGITWFAQVSLNEVVYFEAPAVGGTVTAGTPYTTVESLKAMSDVFAPLSGEVIAVNDALARRPDLLNEDPYGRGWTIRVKLADPGEQQHLLASEDYTALVAGEPD